MADPHSEQFGGERSGSRDSYPLPAGASVDAQASYNVVNGTAPERNGGSARQGKAFPIGDFL